MVQLFKILKETPLIDAKMLDQFAYIQPKALLKAENKQYREEMIEIMKEWIVRKENSGNKLFLYINRPVQSQFINVTSQELFDVEHKHLEYFPIVNQRVFKIGSSEKKEEKKRFTPMKMKKGGQMMGGGSSVTQHGPRGARQILNK